MKTLKLLTSRAGKRTILALWLLLTVTAALADETLTYGSEYVNQKIIRNSADQSNDPAPFNLTIITLANGDVKFTISSNDGTTVAWRGTGLDYTKFCLKHNNNPQNGTNMKNNYLALQSPSGNDIILKRVGSNTIFPGAIIVYEGTITYTYGGVDKTTVFNGGEDAIVYTYRTIANPSGTTLTLQNLPLYQDRATATAYMTASYNETTGQITFKINSNQDGSDTGNVAYFRNANGGGFNAAYIYLRSYSTPALCGAKISTYYTRTNITSDSQDNKTIVFTPIGDFKAPADMSLVFWDASFENPVIAWYKSESRNIRTSWLYRLPQTLSGITVTATPSKFSASISVDKSNFHSGSCDVRLKYKKDGVAEYTYANSGNPISSFPYELSVLEPGVKYYVTAEAYYPNYASSTDNTSAETNFTTTAASISVTANNLTWNSASITINRSQFDATAPIKLLYKKTADVEFSYANSGNPVDTSSPFALTGLDYSTQYDIAVILSLHSHISYQV